MEYSAEVALDLTTVPLPVLIMTVIGVNLLVGGVYAALFGKFNVNPWLGLVPIANVFIYLRETLQSTALAIVGMLVPIANLVIPIIALWKLKEGFNAGAGMFILSLLLTPVAMLVYAFGSREWRSHSATQPAAMVMMS